MTVGDLVKYLENLVPPGAALEKDNVGLQIGSRRKRIKNILLCLECDEGVINQAIKKNCNFIFTHHPFIFNPISKIDTDKDNKSRLIEKLIRNDITIYSAHTNLDNIKNGVSFQLAKVLGLYKIKFLSNEEVSQYKVVTFIPKENLEILADSVFKAGGGKIGEYEKCSFRLNGEGTFYGSDSTNPAIGKKKILEKINEVRFEFIADKWNLNNVLKALLNSHPYEEPAYDIYPLHNKNINYGAGAVGELKKEKNINEFLSFVASSLKIRNFRYCEGAEKKIKKVAVCGGSGSFLLNHAINSGADAFITSDIKYHTFQEAEGRILFIDAGHYETEIFSLNFIYDKIKKAISKEVKVFKYSGTTNPVKFYKH